MLANRNVQYGQTRDFAIRYQKSKFGAPKFKVTMKHLYFNMFFAKKNLFNMKVKKSIIL